MAKIKKAVDLKPKSLATVTKTGPKSGEMRRTFKGKEIVVAVNGTDGSYSWDGRTFKSLTAVARQITGYKAVSGPAFFGLNK